MKSTKSQLNKKKFIFIVILFVSVLLLFRGLWIYYHNGSTQPIVKDGIADLRNNELLNHQVVSLNGEWEYYSNTLLDPNQLNHSKSMSTFVKVPVNALESDHKQINKGTYRVRIKVKPMQTEPYSLYLKGIKFVSHVYVNGKRIKEVESATKQGETVLNYRPVEITIDGNTSEIDLVIQIRNNKNRKVDIANSIQFGTYEMMNRQLIFTYAMQFITASVLLLHAVYVFIIFCFFVRRKEMLYLMAAFLSMTIAILVDDDKVLLYLMPSIDFESWLVLIYLSYSSAVFFLVQFSTYITEDFKIEETTSIYLKKTFWIIYLVFIVSVVLIPHLKWTFILFPLVMMYGSWIFIHFVAKGIKRAEKDFIYILLAMISVVLSTIWGGIKTNFHIDYPYYPFDLIIGVVIFSSFWFKRFFQSTKESKELAIELQRVDKTRDEFLSNTSHELRNPLHGILTISESIYETEHDQLSDENKRNLQLLMKIGRRMSLILNDLLDMSKLKAGNIQLHVKPVNILSVLKNVLEILQFMKEGKNIIFDIKIPDNFPLLKADEDRLYQILFNLIHNGLKYTKEGVIQIAVSEDNNMAKISVTDTGMGIHYEQLDSIFQPYFQDRNSGNMNAGGIGLGLSICKQFVELHGGELTVSSQFGIGSTFTFSIPLETNQSMSSVVSSDIKGVLDAINIKEVPKQATKNNNNPTILVVDDDVINVTILKSALSTEAYNVITCTSGEEALHLLNQGIWDLVITDVMMPGLSGYDLTRKIRERYSITELPIIMLTARSRMEDMQAGFFHGANDYVTKPVEQQELKARVKVLVELRKSVNDRIRLEAAWLQAQIQPHFLFNTLNTIAALSEIDQVKMLHLLEQFGNYLRACFSTQNLNRLVPLKKEIDLVQSYLYIEKERFGKRITVEWNVSFENDIYIPPLILQTLVENAIKHGVLKRPEGGRIRIQVLEGFTDVVLSIEDNGVGIPERKLQTLLENSTDEIDQGIGLVNSNKRLKQLYGKGLEISSGENIGTTVKFVIPKNVGY